MTTRSALVFSSNLQAFMDVAGMNRTELAEICGMPLPRISELFANRYGKTLETVDGFCDSLNRFCREQLGISRSQFTSEMLISEDFNVPTIVVLALQKRSSQKKLAATA